MVQEKHLDTTWFEESEKETSYNEECYRDLVDNLIEGVFQTTPGGTFLMANRAMARMFGYESPSDLIANITDVGRQLLVDSLRREELSLAMAKGLVTNFEAQLCRKDGNIIWVTMNARAIYNEEDKLSHFEGTFSDITDRKGAEEALHRNVLDLRRTAAEEEVIAEIGRIVGSSLDIESVYRRFANEAQKLIKFKRITITLVDYDTDSGVIAFITTFGRNSATAESLGRHALALGDRYSLKESVTGAAIRARTTVLLQPEEASKISTLDPSTESGDQSFLSSPLIFQDRVIGALVFRSISGEIYDERDVRLAERIGNQIAGAIGISQMYGNLQSAEAAQRRSDAQYRGLVDNLTAGIFQTTPDGGFLSSNHWLADMLGYNCTQELMTEVTDIGNQLYVDPRRRTEFTKELAQGSVTHFETQLYRKDGSIIWVVMNARGALDLEGNIDHFEGTVVDITERKSLEREVARHTENLEKAYRDLQQLDELKDEFLSSVSHELRTPLTAIKGSAELLLDGEGVDDQIRQEFLTIINSESDRLTRLINDLLDLSRIEAGKESWNDDWCSLSEIVTTAVSALQVLGSQKDIDVRVSLDPDLPSVRCDVDKIDQVLTNLLSNAIKFTPSGGTIQVTGKARLMDDCSGDNGVVEINVTDNGVGMAVEDLGIIFQKFKQVGNTPEDLRKGTGLGLPICQHIINHYGGHIWADSKLDEGSSFKFTLPIGQRNSRTRAQTHNLASISQSPDQRKTILVVDDEANVRRLLNHELTNRGYLVLEAGDGKTAVELAREHRPDLITMDVLMPIMDGYDATLVIKGDPAIKDIPVLVISVDERPGRGFEFRANEFISKPFSVDMVIERISRILGGKARKALIADNDVSVCKDNSFLVSP